MTFEQRAPVAIGARDGTVSTDRATALDWHLSSNLGRR
jgi:hypothetical protein